MINSDIINFDYYQNISHAVIDTSNFISPVNFIETTMINEESGRYPKRQIKKFEHYMPIDTRETKVRKIKKKIKLEEKVLSVAEAKLLTPTKKFRVKYNQDTASIDIKFSPATKKKYRATKNAITNKTHKKEGEYYRFKLKSLLDPEDVKEYVGYTTSGLTRGPQHCLEALRESRSEGNKKSNYFHQNLVAAVQDPSKEITFGMYPFKVKKLDKTVMVRQPNGKTKEMSIGGRNEQIIIQAKKSLRQPNTNSSHNRGGGLNTNRGGGEGRNSKKKFKI